MGRTEERFPSVDCTDGTEDVFLIGTHEDVSSAPYWLAVPTSTAVSGFINIVVVATGAVGVRYVPTIFFTP